LELLEFDLRVSLDDAWEATETMSEFLEEHFTRCLNPEDREAILKDFPKPNSQALQVTKLDDQVKDHLKKKGINSHFRAEKSLHRIQSQVLDMAGPLACLWSDLLDTGATIKREQIILLVQHTLILLGSLSNSITLERRWINWSKLNPALKDIPVEEDEEASKGKRLFGGKFMEKANKRLEEEKTLSKVAGLQRETPAAKWQRFSHDSTDLCSFWTRVPLLMISTAAGVPNASSCTPRTDRPSNRPQLNLEILIYLLIIYYNVYYCVRMCDFFWGVDHPLGASAMPPAQ